MKCDRAVFLPQSETSAIRAEAEATRARDEERRLKDNLLPTPIPQQEIRGLTGYRLMVDHGEKVAGRTEPDKRAAMPWREYSRGRQQRHLPIVLQAADADVPLRITAGVVLQASVETRHSQRTGREALPRLDAPYIAKC